MSCPRICFKHVAGNTEVHVMMITFISEIKCQFSLVWPYICISMVLLNIDHDYRAVCWKVRWLQVVCPLWIHQCWIFCSMIICTVKANSHVQFLYIDVYMYCKIDEGTRILLGVFFLLNCYFYYPFFYKYLNCLIFMFENFMFCCCLFSEIEEHFFSPLMYACFCCHFWRYYITQLNSTMNLSNWCFD